jgi:hypothetical protein
MHVKRDEKADIERVQRVMAPPIPAARGNQKIFD